MLDGSPSQVEVVGVPIDPMNTSEFAAEKHPARLPIHRLFRVSHGLMIATWFGWAVVSWTLWTLAAVLGFGGATGWVSGLIQHSTVYALVAAAAFISPLTVRSVFVPAILYSALSISSGVLIVIQILVQSGPSYLALDDIVANFASSFGAWIWLGVCFFLAAQLSGLRVTRQPGAVYDVFTVKKLMAATSLACLGLALQHFDVTQQVWAEPNGAKLLRVLLTPLGAIVWCVVLGTQLSSLKLGWLLVVLTTVFGIAVNEALYAVVWSRMEFKEANVTLSHPTLWESGLSWLMSMLGVWIALRIARLGGYRVVRTSVAGVPPPNH